MSEQLVAGITPVEAIVRLAQKVPVFPCRRSAEEVVADGRTRLRKPKSPLTERGFHDASQDADQIRAWWRRWPDALVGVPTGSKTGLVVIDYDAHKADTVAQEWIAEHAERLMGTRTHGTLSGGRHYLFKAPPGQTFTSGVNVQLGERKCIGIDIRAEGGYIVWWPAHGAVTTGEVAALPAGLVDRRQIDTRPLPPLPVATPEKWAKDRGIVSQALAFIDPAGHDDWVKAGMAIHLASDGSEDGFHLWHAWSAGELTGDSPPSYSGEADCRYRWASFNRDGRARAGMVTLGSVFALAAAGGWIAPPPTVYEPPIEIDEVPVQPSEAEAEPATDRRPLNWPALLFQGEPPARQWAIPHWLGIGHVTLLAGPGGVGKSLLAQQIGSSLATGDAFIEKPERAYKTLMWMGEDDHDELWRRQVQIAGRAGRELTDYAGLVIESYAGRNCTLAETVFGAIAGTAMLKELEEQVADYDAEVVILDNIARLFGGNENERHHVTTFVNLIAGACNRKRPTAIVLLGHPAKVEGSEWAGSTAWEAAVRSRWFFGRTLPDAAGEALETDPDVRYLARRKSNYSALDALQMRMDPAAHILTIPEAPAAARDRVLHPARAEAMVLEALGELVKQGVATSDEKRNQAFLPRVMVERKMAQRTQIPALMDALYRLRSTGKVDRVQVGQYANRTPRMGLGVA